MSTVADRFGFKVGDRVVRTGGERLRGFVTAILRENDTLPLFVRWDDGSESEVAPQRIALAEPTPAGWVPHCGDRVRVLVKDQTGRSAYIVNTEDPERVFVALLAHKGAVAGPYAPSDLELIAPARPGRQERTSP